MIIGRIDDYTDMYHYENTSSDMEMCSIIFTNSGSVADMSLVFELGEADEKYLEKNATLNTGKQIMTTVYLRPGQTLDMASTVSLSVVQNIIRVQR